VFYTRQDLFLLNDGKDGVGQFDLIGTENEVTSFHLSHLLSSDEMQLSALLSMLSQLRISTGNCGRKEDPHNGHAHIPQGVYIGSVGARFQRPDRMEWEQMVVSSDQNTRENGYGLDAAETNPRTHYLRIWSEF
jgi:hypothetical protein